MKADVIDYDTYLTGEDRAAQFFAAWSFVTKMAIAIAILVTNDHAAKNWAALSSPVR